MSLLGEGIGEDIDERIARETGDRAKSLSKGQHAVIQRMHARENARDTANLGWVAAGIGAAVLVIAAARKRV